MKTPMIVTWHARRTGISDKRAEALWREAVRDATVKTGWVGTSDYYAAAVQRFLELIAAEAPAAYAAENLAPLVRAHTRVWLLPLMVYRTLALHFSRNCARPNKLRAA
ncbi:MAG: hypothetical protein AB1768_12865 [Pseudomonadota bacterium]|jgi:maltooligosyltrehalose synthase